MSLITIGSGALASEVGLGWVKWFLQLQTSWVFTGRDKVSSRPAGKVGHPGDPDSSPGAGREPRVPGQLWTRDSRPLSSSSTCSTGLALPQTQKKDLQHTPSGSKMSAPRLQFAHLVPHTIPKR